jgi:hypothetical protein
VALVLAAALNAERYFVDMARNPGVWGAAYPVQTRVGEFVRHLARTGSAGGGVYVSSGMSRHPVFVYLTEGLDTATFDGAALSQPVRPGSLFVITGRTAGEHLRALAPYLGDQPTPWRRGPVFPGTEEPSFLAYRARGEPPIR